MKTFQVYKHPIAGIEAIKVGFSFPAFFFGWIWMFIKKLWGYGCFCPQRHLETSRRRQERLRSWLHRLDPLMTLPIARCRPVMWPPNQRR